MAPTELPTRDIASDILHSLSLDEPVLTAERFPQIPFEPMKAALDRLSSRCMVEYEPIDRELAGLEAEAESIVAHGSHEARVFEAVSKGAEGGITVTELEKAIGDKGTAKVGLGQAFKEKWVKKQGDKIVALVPSIQDITRDQLRTIQEKHSHPQPEVLAALKKRKLVKPYKTISFRIRKGPKYALEMVKEETDLTAEMLASGAWSDEKTVFKPYNFNALGAEQRGGALHPLNKVRTEFRNIFFEMGFEEMPTSNFVTSGFWNFDALFVPQQHPARDLQDTFYVSDPPQADRPRPAASHGSSTSSQEDYDAYWHNVRAVHQDGKYGSIGYRYPWSEDEALRLVLRTHTTATSAVMLYELAGRIKRDGPQAGVPARYFSIDRVFRNETVDATHLAEFHQVEGVIADYDLTLGGLMDFMSTFFAKMGLTDLKFKPAYNPYTEPSMEIFAYHSKLKKLVEIGNSGMFRPEMLEPMGLPRDLRVYGWGLSLERPTMIKYGISNIRQLLGHKVDLNFVKRNPAVRLDKD